MDYAIRHNLTLTAVDDLLPLFHLTLPPGNKCSETKYKFYKFFEEIQNPIIKHFFCLTCNIDLGTENDTCLQCEQKTKNYYIEVSQISQLRNILRRPEIQRMLHEFRTRERLPDDMYGGLTSARIYRFLSEAGRILSFPNNVSFLLYFDEVAVFHSSK